MAGQTRICGEKEQWRKSRYRWLCQDGKMSEYRALPVENCIDRLLKTLAPPAKPNKDANWTIPESLTRTCFTVT